MKRLEKYRPLLDAIRTSDPKTRVGILRSAPDEFIKTLLEVVVNFLAGNLPPHDSNQYKTLRRHKLFLRQMGDQRSVQKTRRSLIKQKGGILPHLLASITGINKMK